MISYAAARRILLDRAASFGTEEISLGEADGRVLTGPVSADRDYPPFNRATMDGYALKMADIRDGVRRFGVIETIYAGRSATVPYEAGGCYKIMTGAPVPDGVDMIVRREDTEEDASGMTIRAMKEPAGALSFPVRPFLNIARRGEDLRAGQSVLPAALRCTPALTGLLASLGKTELLVERLPRVAIITTGDEIVPVSAAVNSIQIRNSNRWLLHSFLKTWQIEPCCIAHVPDDKAFLRKVLEENLSADIVLICGGVSAGDADYVPEVLTGLGVDCLFHKIAIKPGKPVWCGAAPGKGLVLALPGNPFSCLTGFVLLLQPYLRACFGLPDEMAAWLPLAVVKKKKTPLDEFFPVTVQKDKAVLQPAELNGSGDIRLAMEATALAIHPAGEGDLSAGQSVQYFGIPGW